MNMNGFSIAFSKLAGGPWPTGAICGLRALRRKTFPHGVRPAPRKEATEAAPIRRLPFAPRLIVPLAQHTGAPSVPVVRPGQEVVRGEPIARADAFVSVPAHAPATGVIEAIERRPGARGEKVEAIVLRPYPGSSQEVLYANPRDLQALSRDALIRAIQDTGLVGLGGAAFPTHVKLAVPADKPVDTLVVNGCECEPYLTTDHRIMVEHTGELMRGIGIALQACGAQRAVIGVEDNMPDAEAALRARLPAGGAITVQALATKYPQGSEKLLIRALLGREVPSGGLPAAVGVVVNNVGSLASLGALLPRGEGLIERVVTVSGPGVRGPGNYRVPLGTPVSFVLEQLGFEGPAGEVILGGPMMGTAVASLDVPVTKGVSGIVVFNRPAIAAESRAVYPCIKCGKCVEACPMHLNPAQLGLLGARREFQIMEERFHLNDCFECGCCAYVCPSAIPLVQHFRIAKAFNREQRQAAA